MNTETHLPFVTQLISVLDKSDFGRLISTSMIEIEEEVIIDIEPLAIPQYPAFDVHPSERVRIVVSQNDMPVVYCRNDFPIVPHLIVDDDGQKSLCLFDVPFYDIRYMFNPSLFLHRIRNWFEKTARNELHQINQPLEPFFPYSENAIIFLNPSHPFHYFKEHKTYCGNMLIETNGERESGSTLYLELITESKKTYDQNIINSMPRTLGELDQAFESDLLVQIEDCLEIISRIKMDSQIYKRYFKQSDKALRSTKVFVIVSVSLSRNGGVEEAKSIKCFLLDVDLQAICQSFGYEYPKKGAKLVKVRDTLDYEKIPLIPYEVHFQLTADLAQKYNGEFSHRKQETLVQIGVGALGSQIANNCIRSGYGEWVFVDDDVLLPHNLARHCLSFWDVGKNKAIAMTEYAHRIVTNPAERAYQAINGNVLKQIETIDIQNAIKEASLVVDTSASVALGRALCNQYAGSTRCISIFMNPKGNSLIVLLENKNRSISLDILEMQYYKILLHTPEFEKHLFIPDRVVYSSGCRSSSVTLSQDNISVFSGFASKVIKNVPANENAHIYLWRIGEMKLDYFHFEGIKYSSTDVNGWNVKVSDELISLLFSKRNEKMPNETGGILIGTFDYEHNMCYVVDTIDSPEDSEEYPSAFIRGKSGVKDAVKRVEAITAGNLSYIGEWHSHPVKSTAKSTDDDKLLESISSFTYVTQCTPGCMIIVGEANYSIYLSHC